METIQKAYAYPQYQFEELCISNGWDDSNVESLDNCAFISILDYDDTNHFFKENHSNVLNIEFADVGSIGWKHITQEQIETIRDFIESNKGKDFYIHCVAGQSRSQAVSLFIAKHIDGYSEASVNPKNPPFTPNWYVYSELSKSYIERDLNVAFNNLK